MIIFASYGFRSPVVAERLKTVVENPGEKTVAVFPFAGFNSESAGEREKAGLSDFGFLPENIYVLSENPGEKTMPENPDYIYVPGGNPFKLLKVLKETGYDRVILEKYRQGSAYIGISAGAYVAAESIEYVRRLEDDNNETDDYSALGITDAAVLCHADCMYASAIADFRLACPGKRMIILNNDEIYTEQ